MAIKIYQLLTFIAGPMVDIYLMKRKKTGKEDPKRFKERLGYASSPRPKGPIIWFHAASVGESVSILPIIQKISKSFDNINILLTTGTLSSAKLVESRLPDNAFHQYIPVDKITSVNRFLKHWKPNLAIWVESELWPNLVTQTAKQCPMLLINGRMSDSSLRKWKRCLPFSKHILGSFTQTLPQSKLDAERFEELGARNVKYIGNIKFDAPPLPSDPKKMGELVGRIGDRTVWLAASTHNGEEQIIAQVHKELKENHPDILTIIVPRHPQRAEEISGDITKMDLKVAIRSKDAPIEPETDIYLADTMGELGIFYRLVPIVFIGGSLVNHGGQNPLESARLECAIIYGPYMDNFKEITQDLEQNNAAIRIKDKNGLKDTIEELISNHEKLEKLSKASQEIVKKRSGVLDAYVEEMTPFIEKIAKRKNETEAA